LFLATVALFMLGAVLAAGGTQGTGWAAIAAVAVADLGLIPIFLGPHQAYRATILVVLGVHGGCTTIAAWWARRARGGDEPARAKAAEAGRILAGGWLAFLLLIIAAAGEPISTVLPDSTFVNLFVILAISTVIGAGHTKYVEAKQGLPAPEPDALNHLATRAQRAADRLRHWLRAGRQRLYRAPSLPPAARPTASSPPIGPDPEEAASVWLIPLEAPPTPSRCTTWTAGRS
jgi:hypothetical protein